MSNERKLSKTEFTDKVPLLNDNSQHNDSKTGKILFLLLLVPYILVNVPTHSRFLLSNRCFVT